MKTFAALLAIALFASTAVGAFFPLSLQEKTEKADLIARGKVVKISRLMPDNGLRSDERVGFDGTEGSYMGPRSIAVVEIKEVWKVPARTAFWSNERSERAVVPQRIMVPCDYSFEESPSDLTVGREYVLFLKSMTANIYHPLDPASTHVIHDGRVADFGMNHPPNMKSQMPGKELFTDRSTLIEEFKTSVTGIVNAKRDVAEQISR